ncbi:VOC family protein [Lysobacter korlensis]|uniref:VOC family protein n=1 Tax=Lysobacter korlensis TaxID=553636 RepID=A0ABV6RNI5_9GAMM
MTDTSSTDPTFTPAVHYQEPKAAVAWLERAFGFEITEAIDGPGGNQTMSHYELGVGGRGRVMAGGEWNATVRSPASVEGVNTQTVHVLLTEDLDAHCERARAAGAVIVAEPTDEPYGDRVYRAADPEGHLWTFAMHLRDA